MKNQKEEIELKRKNNQNQDDKKIMVKTQQKIEIKNGRKTIVPSTITYK